MRGKRKMNHGERENWKGALRENLYYKKTAAEEPRNDPVIFPDWIFEEFDDEEQQEDEFGAG